MNAYSVCVISSRIRHGEKETESDHKVQWEIGPLNAGFMSIEPSLLSLFLHN
jgi:hypothetical protein